MKEADKENIEQKTNKLNEIQTSHYSKGSDIENDYHLASCNCDFRTLSNILSKNPQLVNAKSPYNGYTALHFACKFGANEVIRCLVGNYNADVNIITSQSGKTPLHIAVEFKKEDSIRLLLSQYNANKALRDYNGQLPADLITGDGIESIMKLVGPATESTTVRPSKAPTPTLSSLKKGLQSISTPGNSDNPSRSFFSFRKGSEAPANPNHLTPNTLTKESGHSMPHLAHSTDMMSIKKTMSILSSRPHSVKHNSAVRATPLSTDDDHTPRQ